MTLLLLIQPGSRLAAQRSDNAPDTVHQGSLRVRGPRIGFDVAGLALLYFEPERKIYTFSIDYEAWQDIYPVIEFGYQNVVVDRDTYRYGSSGIFARGGVDINLLKYEETNVYEMMYAGLRYGIAYMTHQVDDIHIREGYFGDLDGASLSENEINAHWVSLVAGLRVEVFRNFFMGWSVLANFKFAQIEDIQVEPYNIPGFGPGDKKASIVINYTLAYRIPLQRYHPRKIIKKRSDKK